MYTKLLIAVEDTHSSSRRAEAKYSSHFNSQLSAAHESQNACGEVFSSWIQHKSEFFTKVNIKLVQAFPNYRNLVFLRRFSLCLAMTSSPSSKPLTRETDCSIEPFKHRLTEGLVALTSLLVLSRNWRNKAESPSNTNSLCQLCIYACSRKIVSLLFKAKHSQTQILIL